MSKGIKILLAFFVLIAIFSVGVLLYETYSLKSEMAEVKTNNMQVEKFAFPLPEKYRYSQSSPQGLRKSIPNAGIGGEGTLNTYHNAIDFAVPIRTPVYAVKSGTIINVYPSYDNGQIWKGHPTYGGMVEIQHSDSTRTLYAHLIRTDVKEGDTVEKGQQIGASGGKRGMRGSGNSTGAHLHYAVYIDIQYSFED